MNEATQPVIEPVTDEDVLVAVNLPARALEPHTRRILEQDRRRVAERQAPEIERLRAEVAQADADYNDAVTLAQMNLDLLKAVEAEVAALKAAEDSLLDRLERAKAAQANMIDATGAVETGVFWYSGRYVVEIPKSMALSRVLIVPVRP